MPIFEIEANGKTFEVEAPDMASAAAAVGGTEAAPAKPEPTMFQKAWKLITAEPGTPEHALSTENVGDFAKGTVRGMRDVPDAGAQIVTRALEAAAKGVGGAAIATGAEPVRAAAQSAEALMKGERENVETINKAAEEDYRKNWLKGRDPGAATAGRIAGNVLASAPLAAAVPGATAASLPVRALSGAGSGAVSTVMTQPVAEGGDFWTEKAKQAAIGAGTGAAAPVVLEGAARVVKPKVSAAVAKLREMGVSPTPGQIIGGPAKSIEEAVSSVPILGDVVKSAQRRAVADFNRGTVNKALAPLGEKLPKSIPAGHDAISYLGSVTDDAYDKLVPTLSAKVDTKFLTEMQNLRALAKNMVPARAEQFEKILDEQLIRKIPQSGVLTGETLQEAKSAFGRLASTFGNSVDGDQRLLADALKETKAQILKLLKRSNPDKRFALDAIDKAYAMQLRLENAAARTGSSNGIFTPAGLKVASKTMDTSLRKRATAQGRALLQPEAEAAKEVLGATVPDSGTPFRLLTALGLLGGTGWLNPWAGAAGGLAALPYTPIGQRATAALLTGRQGPGYGILAEALRKSAPTAAAAAPIALERSR